MGMFDGLVSSITGGDILKAGAGLVGSVLGGFGQAQSNQKSWDIAMASNAASAEQAQKQMDFQERMRSTQYQTAVQDLKDAGLNPMLAYTQGGAGTPAGSAAVGQQATLHNPTQGLANSAATIANIKADLEQKEAQTVESISRVGVNDEQRKLISANTALAILEAPNVSLKNKAMAQEILLNQAKTSATSAEESAIRLNTKIRAEGDLPEAKKKGEYFNGTPYNPYYLKDITQGINSAGQAVRSIR